MEKAVNKTTNKRLVNTRERNKAEKAGKVGGEWGGPATVLEG